MEPSVANAFKQPSFENFRGDLQAQPSAIDEEIARVGPGTPCGEYMRRFWHPIFITNELGELPKAIRALGEDLRAIPLR